METLIEIAYPILRQIVFHSDGRIVAKAGGKAKHPKRLYSGSGKTISEKTLSAIHKLIQDNDPTEKLPT